MAVAGGGEHKEDRIISVRVLLRRCPFAGPVTDSSRLSLSLSFSLYPVADLIAAESVRCSYAEEGHAACEGAGEHEKRPAAAATARKLRRAARRDDDRSGSGRALSQRTYRRDQRQALAIAEETPGPDDGRGCRGVLAGSRRLGRYLRHQVRFIMAHASPLSWSSTVVTVYTAR